jgi:Rieske Fe-S protein
MKINRREFLLLTAGIAAGCQTADNAGHSAADSERAVNAGAAGNYAADGVYNDFRDTGFFVVRRGDKLVALSSYCTHRKCKLIAEPDHSFYCKCHGSTFDPAGHVTRGPATHDLPVLPTYTNEQGQLLVKLSGV